MDALQGAVRNRQNLLHILAEIAQCLNGSTGGRAGKAILVDDAPKFLLAKDIPKNLDDLGR